MIIIIIRSK